MSGQLDPWIRQRARQLRHRRIDAEGLMWMELRRRRLRGFRFRREHPIGRFILDFYCAEKRVAVEIDGPTHDADADERRDALLAAHGVRVVRFLNEEIYRDIAGCLEGLGEVLETRPSFPRSDGRTRRGRVADLHER